MTQLLDFSGFTLRIDQISGLGLNPDAHYIGGGEAEIRGWKLHIIMQGKYFTESFKTKEAAQIRENAIRTLWTHVISGVLQPLPQCQSPASPTQSHAQPSPAPEP